jgi:hypothetical protein
LACDWGMGVVYHGFVVLSEQIVLFCLIM